MQTFAIKHRAQLTWEDLPFVEAPVFAHTHIMQMLNNPNQLWMRIENLPEFIRTEIGSYSSLRNHDYANNQIERLIGSGLYFNVCRTGKPFCAAFTWQEDPEHPHKGFWTDPLNYYWRASVAIKNQLMLIANQWHRLQTQNNSDESSLDEWISKTGTVAYAADPFTAKGMSSGYALSPREQLKYISPATEKSEIKPVDYLGIVDDTLADMKLFSMEKDTIDMDTSWKDVRGFKYRKQNDYNDYILSAASAYPRVSPLTLKAVLSVESAFNSNAYNSVGYAGIAQLGPSEAKTEGGLSLGNTKRVDGVWQFDLSGDERFDPQKSITASATVFDKKAQYIDNILEESKISDLYSHLEKEQLYVASYNAGQGTIGGALKNAISDGFVAPKWEDLIAGNKASDSYLWKAMPSSWNRESKYNEITNYQKKVMDLKIQ